MSYQHSLEPLWQIKIWKRNLLMFRGRCINWWRPVSYWLTSGYGQSCIFYTDGSLIEDCAGFAAHQMGVGRFGYKIRGVFTAELFSLFYDTSLRLYGLCRGVLFSLIAWVRSRLCCLGKLHIRLTLWCMNVNNCAGACARKELKWSWCGFHLT
jgi:hypothetical protein